VKEAMDNVVKYLPAENKRERRLRLMQEARFGTSEPSPSKIKVQQYSEDSEDEEDYENMY